MTSHAPPHRGLRAGEAAVLALLGAIWGASFLFVEVALDEVGPIFVVAARVATGAVGITAFLCARRGPSAVRAAAAMPLTDVLVLSFVASALPFLLVAWAQTRITATLAAILNGSLPLATALLAVWLFPAARMRSWRSVGLVVGFGGVTLVTLTTDGGGPGGNAAGIAAMLLAVLSYAYGAHYAGRRFGRAEPTVVAMAQMQVCTVVLVPLAAVVDRPDRVPSARVLASLAALGFVGTAVAWCLYYWLLARAGPQHTVSVQYLAPLAGVCYGALVLQEQVRVATLVGMAVIVAGELVVALPTRRPAAGPRAPPPVAVDAY